MILDRQKNYYPFLDGLRAIAFIAVLIAHISGFFKTSLQPGLFYKLISFLGPLGHLGVDLFFLISGFLITGVLVADFDQPINLRRFYWRRFLRIVPSYLFCILVVMAVMFIFKQRSSFDQVVWWPHWLLLQNYVVPVPMLAHTWSLAIEEHFYLVYPLIVLGVFRSCKKPELRRRFLIIVIFILAFVVVVSRHVMDPINLTFSKAIDVRLTTLFRLDGLLWGCLLKLLEPYYALLKTSWGMRLAPLLMVIPIFVLVYFIHSLDSIGRIICWDKYLLSSLASIALFFTAYFGFKPLNYFLENVIVRGIGRVSYAGYLWHYPLIFMFTVLIFPSTNPTVVLAAYLLSLALLVFVSTYTIERYFLSFKSRF